LISAAAGSGLPRCARKDGKTDGSGGRFEIRARIGYHSYVVGI
jgi:hypothetical protein